MTPTDLNDREAVLLQDRLATIHRIPILTGQDKDGTWSAKAVDDNGVVWAKVDGAPTFPVAVCQLAEQMKHPRLFVESWVKKALRQVYQGTMMALLTVICWLVTNVVLRKAKK